MKSDTYSSAEKKNGASRASEKNAATYEALGAILLWGIMPTCTKLLVTQIEPMFALALTSLFASLFLAVYYAVKGKLGELKDLSLNTFLRMTAIGSLGVFFYNFFYYSGNTLLPAQTAYIINDLWPACIILFSCMILKEKLTVGKLLAVLMSFAGVVIVATGGSFQSFDVSNTKGALFCLAAAVSYGFYAVLNKRESYDKEISVLVAFATSGLAAFICALFMGQMRPLTLKEWGGSAFAGAVCNGLPGVLWVVALQNGNTAILANLSYLTPVISMIVTHFVLGEPITVWSIVGTALIVSGIFMQILADRLMKKKHS